MPERKEDSPVVPSGWNVLEKRVANLEAQVQALAPLGELLPHITPIKRTFGAGG